MIKKAFADGSWLEYDQGSFDSWCVYYVNPQGVRKPPKDTAYFSALSKFSKLYGAGRIYKDFVKVYDWTTREYEPEVMQKITQLATGYQPQHQLNLDKIYSILYMAMISEERRAYTRLGKRIKRLGLHVLLVEGSEPGYAAEFMNGMGWRQIDAMCRERGF